MYTTSVIEMIAFASYLGFFAAFIATFLYYAAPVIWPGARGRAARRVDAMCEWQCRHDHVERHYSRAAGYFKERDYLGVESAYLEARRIVDGEK